MILKRGNRFSKEHAHGLDPWDRTQTDPTDRGLGVITVYS